VIGNSIDTRTSLGVLFFGGEERSEEREKETEKEAKWIEDAVSGTSVNDLI